MDIQRVLILLGLAVTTYMLILAWNEDYHQGSTQTSGETVVLDESASLADTVPSMSEITTTSPGDIVPSLEGDEITPKVVDIPVARNLLTITTDVLVVKIDTLGGDVVSVALPKFPAKLATLLFW
jgi:YidC/Oxa1 family membrane protein insertase